MTDNTVRQPSKAPRFHALDGLRGAAALLVVFFHMNWANHVTGAPFIRNGYIAVDLFFMLSGLVIAANYSERIRSWRSVYEFMRLRFFRLYPLHFVLLVAFVGLECVKFLAVSRGDVAANIASFSSPNSAGALVANVFLVQAWHLFPAVSFNAPSWSISCEVGAYIMFAIVAWLGLLRHRLFGWLGGVSVAACYVALAFTPKGMDSSADWGILRCWGAFALGMLIWRYVPQRRWIKSVQLNSIVQFVTVAAIVADLTVFRGIMLMTAIPLFSVLIVSLQTDTGMMARMLNTRPLQVLGSLSYSVYMVHSLLFICLVQLSTRLLHVPLSNFSDPGLPSTSGNPWVGDVLVVGMLAIVLGVAAFTFRFIEEPGRLYGKRTAGRGRPSSTIRPHPVIATAAR